MAVHIIVLVKPDGVARNLTNEVRDVYLRAGFKLEQENECPADQNAERLAAHYKEHEGKEFYDRLIHMMLSGPIVAMQFSISSEDWQENSAMIAKGRSVCKRYSLGGANNTVHASDSIEAGERECSIWFTQP